MPFRLARASFFKTGFCDVPNGRKKRTNATLLGGFGLGFRSTMRHGCCHFPHSPAIRRRCRFGPVEARCIPARCSSARRTARIIFMATQNPKKPPSPAVSPPSTGNDDSVVLERRTQRTQPPQMFQVVLLNDDFTPMEFVVHVIQEFFSKDRETATQIMLKIHLEGKGICGVYSRDVASTKVDQVLQAARAAGHPLQCLSEPVE